ncbi:hypothetical protein ACJVC5_11990 [Peredibacter sp. HCB2-198]|uniref:hypothetical protein n=1 Tax=Peredibacter sp. HCB2-198 TaxID=3383025 RepID=UPI0038B45346
MKQFLLLTLALLLSTLAIGQEEQTKKMYKLKYLVEQNDTLAKIYKRFVYPNSIITKQTPMTQRTFKGNPEVKDWNKLEPGSMIDLYIQYEYLDMSKYQAYIDGMKVNLKKAAAQNETENSGPGFLPEGLKASIFYMASYGKFTQKDPATAEVEFYQNSPVTLGLSSSYYPKQSLWSFQASAYASYLLASANNLDDKNVKVDPELGLTFYPEYRFVKQNFTGYFGVDYERFSTFNMGGIQQDRTILLDSNTVLYGTVGFSKLVHVFKTPFFTKLSFSHSIVSKNDPNSKGIKNTDDYTGYKILWYVNKKFTERLYLHTLFKYHVMDGPSELKTLRLGIGFGYILF